MEKNRLKVYLLWLTILSLILLCCPIMFLKIGPEGYIYYGPGVPDIYILGGYILGKDTGWWAIGLAYKFQLGMILLYAVIAFLCYTKNRQGKRKWVFMAMCWLSAMLLLFPLWMAIYTSHVINNSDGADLTTYPHIGWILYAALVILHILIFRELYKKEKFKVVF